MMNCNLAFYVMGAFAKPCIHMNNDDWTFFIEVKLLFYPTCILDFVSPYASLLLFIYNPLGTMFTYFTFVSLKEANVSCYYSLDYRQTIV